MNMLPMFLRKMSIRLYPMLWPGKLKRFMKIAPLLLLGISMNACSKTTWKEEVLLHDGSKIIVDRSLSHGGRHELAQGLPIKEHDITFTVPGTNKPITWKDEYDESWGYSNFNLLALHILNGIPYIVAGPELCMSYNKWGRPNPPYVIFKYDGNAWQRIQIAELPNEFKTINVVVFIMSLEKKLVAQSPVPASVVKEFNSGLPYKEYKSILREPIKITCEELVFYKGAWVSPGDSIGKQMMDHK